MLFETDHKIGVCQVSKIWSKIWVSAYMDNRWVHLKLYLFFLLFFDRKMIKNSQKIKKSKICPQHFLSCTILQVWCGFLALEKVWGQVFSTLVVFQKSRLQFGKCMETAIFATVDVLYLGNGSIFFNSVKSG